MTRSEFKKLYTFFRTTKREFEAHMQDRQYPCGYDDMMYERFEAHTDKWLDNNPVIKAVVEADLNGDALEDKLGWRFA